MEISQTAVHSSSSTRLLTNWYGYKTMVYIYTKWLNAMVQLYTCPDHDCLNISFRVMAQCLEYFWSTPLVCNQIITVASKSAFSQFCGHSAITIYLVIMSSESALFATFQHHGIQFCTPCVNFTEKWYFSAG